MEHMINTEGGEVRQQCFLCYKTMRPGNDGEIPVL